MVRCSTQSPFRISLDRAGNSTQRRKEHEVYIGALSRAGFPFVHFVPLCLTVLARLTHGAGGAGRPPVPQNPLAISTRSAVFSAARGGGSRADRHEGPGAENSRLPETHEPR